jgi:hypothetical protein
MMFAVRWTPEARKQYDTLKAAAGAAEANRRAKRRKKKSRQEGLFLQVAKAIRLLCRNPRHPSLQTHEFTSLPHPFDPDGKVFEAYAQQHTPGAYRIFWCYGPARRQIPVLSILPHP